MGRMRAPGIWMAVVERGVAMVMALGMAMETACALSLAACVTTANAADAGPSAAAASSSPTPPSRPEPTPPLTLGALTSAVLDTLHPDGTSDPSQLQTLLTTINRQVAAHLVLDRNAQSDAATAISEAPLGGSGWRLWVFWAVDVPECNGLATALVQLRSSRLAVVRPVHLCGLHHWEAWMAEMNQQREALVAAAQAQDAGACATLSQRWRDQLREFVAEIAAFYHGSVPLMGNARIAQALQVDHVPCFRLISPASRVHALDGFHAGFPLGAWVAQCQAWEAQADHQGQHQAGTP